MTQLLEWRRALRRSCPQGWYAARHGERRPAPVLSLVTGGRLPLVFGYVLVPGGADPVDLRFHHDAFRLAVTLRIEDVQYVMTVVQGDVEMASREL